MVTSENNHMPQPHNFVLCITVRHRLTLWVLMNPPLFVSSLTGAFLNYTS